MKGLYTEVRNVQHVARVAQLKCWLIDNYFKEYKHLKTAEPHEQGAVHFFAAQFAMKNPPE